MSLSTNSLLFALDREQPYDVLTIEDVEALKRDTKGSRTASVEAEIELGYFVVQMHGIQRYYQHTLLTFLGHLLGVQKQAVTDETDTEVEDVEPTQTSQIDEPHTAPQSKDERIIKGVKGLGVGVIVWVWGVSAGLGGAFV